MDKALYNALSHSAFFDGITQTSLEDIIAAGKQQLYDKDSFLFRQTDPGHSIFILLEGAIKLFRQAQDGKEVIIKLVKPGEIFAEAILFGDSRYPVSAMAVIQSRVFAIHKETFYGLLEKAEFRDAFLSSIMTRLRYLTGRIYTLTAYDVEERFFHFLLSSYGKQREYEINISKKELASAVGTIPETFSRLIHRLSKRGIIFWQGNRLKILDTTIWSYYEQQE
jgi:CRP/FNR family transcriptional regulator